MALDEEARTATLADGRRVRYEALVTTAPLDCTLRLLGQAAWAEALTHRRDWPLERMEVVCSSRTCWDDMQALYGGLARFKDAVWCRPCFRYCRRDRWLVRCALANARVGI